MREPTWKIWLSHLAEIHLESASSAYNPHLYVSLRRGRYQLSTAKAIYSYADLYDNFVTAFQRIDLDKIPGKEVLLLGFGLGSIPVILEKTMQREFYYTAVEVDEVVIDLASRYTLPDLHSPIELICADAYAFVMQSEAQYDLICMDVFTDDTVPSPFEEPDFIAQLQQLLSPGGILLYNRMTAFAKNREQTSTFFKNVFLPVFPEGTYLEVRGNWILLSAKQILKN
ncbi:MAG: spermidine synthase [Saprospiraceae bacterium]